MVVDRRASGWSHGGTSSGKIGFMQVEHSYDVPPRVLLDVLTDEGFLRERSKRFGGRDEPSVTRSDGTIVVTVPRHLPVEAVPGPFRRFVGEGTLVQTDTWSHIADDRISGTWTTDVGKAPLALRGTHEIVATGTGSRYVVTADVKVKIPFGGGAAEKLVRERLAELVRNEQAFAAAWLQR
jgi:hypothetical protein